MTKTAAVAVAEVIIGFLVVLNSMLPALLVIRSRRLRELLMYQLVASVCLGETLTGAVSIILGSSKLFKVPISSWACVIAIYLRSSLVVSATVGIFCISLERYVTVIHGLRYYDILTDSRRRLMLAASWVFAAVFFCIGIATHLSQAQHIDLQGEKCVHSNAVTVTPVFNLFGALINSITYLANCVINIVIGIIGIKQMRKIRRTEVSFGRNRHSTHLQHRGFMAIAFLSVIYCVFVFPNNVTVICRWFGWKVQTTTSKVTGFLRLLGIITDGWCLMLLCPMLREECIKMFSGSSKRRQRTRVTPGNHLQMPVSESRFRDNTHRATANANSNDNIETRGRETLLTTRVAVVSPSVSGVLAKPVSARASPKNVCRGREMILKPLDLHQSITTSAARSPAVSRSTSSAPSARPARHNRLQWSRQYSFWAEKVGSGCAGQPPTASREAQINIVGRNRARK